VPTYRRSPLPLRAITTRAARQVQRLAWARTTRCRYRCTRRRPPEAVTSDLFEDAQAREVAAADRGRRLDLDADNGAVARLHHQVDLVAAPCSEVGQAGPNAAPADLFAELHRHERLSRNRPGGRCSSISTFTVSRRSRTRCTSSSAMGTGRPATNPSGSAAKISQRCREIFAP
jgi:hypothetical protein